MSEEGAKKDERRMLVSTTSTVYPGIMLSSMHGLGRRWGGDELIEALSCLAD